MWFCMRKYASIFSTVLMLLMFVAPPSMAEAVDVRTIRVYVVSLDGVESRAVKNVSRVVDGVYRASSVEVIGYSLGFGDSYGLFTSFLTAEAKVKIEVAVIRDWVAYRLLIDYGSNLIIVNTHGETLPVPSGYTKEEVADRLANSMANRNVTWVNVAGYPFYYVWNQDSLTEAQWGTDGFKRLMGHVGLIDAEIPTTLSASGWAALTGYAGQSLEFGGWTGVYDAYLADLTRPLRGSDFGNYTIMSLYRRGYDSEEFLEGAVLAFAEPGRKTSFSHSFGSFVHFGTSQTYDESGVATDRDYCAGYVATAAALWANEMKAQSKETINRAETAITMAETEERTSGLGEAENLVKRAWEAFSSYWYDGSEGAISLALRAERAAELSAKPSITMLEAGLLMALGIAVTVGVTFFLKRYRKSRSEHGNSIAPLPSS